MSARSSARWGNADGAASADLAVLIPTCGRPSELAVTLSGLAAQVDADFRVLISDQGEEPATASPAVRAMIGVLEAQGRSVQVDVHLPRRGLAEQREHLLHRGGQARQVLYLDDDVWLEPGLVARLREALDQAHCGFVGAAVQGLSYRGERRPQEWAAFQPWTGRPQAEQVVRGSESYERWRLHNAANLTHLAAARGYRDDQWELYKVAWVGGCVLFDRRALVSVGGFSFWRELPASHAGEDALAQARVMERFGGAGLIPSGAVHLEALTTVAERDVDARDELFEPARRTAV